MASKSLPQHPAAMASHHSHDAASPPWPPPKSQMGGRDGLGAYLVAPETLSARDVIFHTPSFVAIWDLYPKATVHALLLPRSPQHTRLHPFEAFADATLLAETRSAAARLKKLVAAELGRRVGGGGDIRSETLGDNDDIDDVGRDWEAEVRVGVHAHPSMNHLHVHVLSRDMHSRLLRHRKHYNSFNTPFFVDLDDLPLAPDDARRFESYLRRDFVCWRCGRGFGSRFTQLKEHLEEEFEEWRRE